MQWQASGVLLSVYELANELQKSMLGRAFVGDQKIGNLRFCLAIVLTGPSGAADDIDMTVGCVAREKVGALIGVAHLLMEKLTPPDGHTISSDCTDHIGCE